MNHPLPRKDRQPVLDSYPENDSIAPPTWLTQNSVGDDSEYLVDQYRQRKEQPVATHPSNSEAYEQYRQRVMERQREQREFQTTPTVMPPIPTRPVFTPEDLRTGDRSSAGGGLKSAGLRYPPETKKSSLLGSGLLMAGVVALAIGGAVGFAATQFDRISEATSNSYNYVVGMIPENTEPVVVKTEAQEVAGVEPAAVVPPETVIVKKPIAIASLSVADVTGTLNSMIPLALNADPAFENQVLAIKVSGLPKSAYLSAGTKISDTTWILKDGEETGINLFVPQSETSQFDVSVSAIETKTGELAAPTKEMTVALSDSTKPIQITPASAPPDNGVMSISAPTHDTGLNATVDEEPLEVPVIATAGSDPESEPVAPAKPKLSGEVAGLLEKGDVLLKSGDLVIARQFYARAFQMGAGEGALGVAKTYDPAVYKKLKVQGIKPDAAKAAEWYGKAKAAGVTASLP